MASKTDPQRILSNTVNLLPPSDKIPEGEALVLEGWRVDQDGNLRTRRGFVNETGILTSGYFHTLTRNGQDRYVGIGPSLYWGHPIPISQGVAVNTFDGAPLGMAFYQGHGWVMNRSAQYRVDGQSATNWGIQAPPNTMTAALQQPQVSLFNPYDRTGGVQPLDFAGYWQQGTSPATFVNLIDANGNPLPANNGSSVAYDVNPTVNPGFGVVPSVFTSAVQAPWEIVTEYAPGFDSTFNGMAGDSDAFHFFLYADDPSQISSVYIQLFSDQNIFGVNAPMVACNFDNSRLAQSLQSWTPMHILRQVNLDLTALPQIITTVGANNVSTPDPNAVTQLINTLARPHFMEYLGGQQRTSFDPSFTPVLNNGLPTFDQGGFTVPNGTFNWKNITACVITVTLAGPTTFGLGLATASQGISSGQWNGTISFFVSYANALDQDSNPNDTPVSVTANNQNITLNNIPTSADPQVTQRFIYAVGGGLSEPLLVATIPDNSTTTWSTFETVTQAQNDFQQMPINRNLPPPARGLLNAPFLGRLIAFNTATNPSRYFWTQVAQPWFFPGAGQETGNWEDLGADQDQILTATYHKQMIVFYRQRSIWRLVGDPDANDAVQSDAQFGAVGANAVANAGAYDFFVGPEGVYRFDGDFTTPVSGPLTPLFKGDFVFVNVSESWAPIDPAGIVNCALGIINDRLYFSYPSVGNTIPNNLLVMHIPTGQWAAVSRGGRFVTAMNYEGAANYLMVGETTPSGAIMESSERYTSDGPGTPIFVEWHTRYIDEGLPDNYKRFSDLSLDFQTAIAGETPSFLNVVVVDENGNPSFLTAISSGTRTTTVPIKLNVSGNNDDAMRSKRIAILVFGNVTSTCIIYGAYLRWYPEERVASTFDSGFSDKEQVSQVDYIELAATGSGQPGTVTLYGDLPGNTLNVNQSVSINVPNGRGTVRQRLPSIVEGRNLRFRTETYGAPFQLHNFRIRHRVIGEYIDGTIGEYWESPEFSVAPVRMAELKDLMLDYDASAPGLLQIYADLPGNALQVVRTLQIPQRSTRGTFTLAFEDSSDTLPYGQLFKARVYPPPGGVLRLHGRATVRARPIGVFFDGSAIERWESQPMDLLGGTGLFREVAIVAQCGGLMAFDSQFELPEENVQVRNTFFFDTTQATSGREPIYSRLPANCKGKLAKFTLRGNFPARLFSVKVYCRGLGNVASPWKWVDVPIPGTPDDFEQLQIPVRGTPEAFTWVDIPVDTIG